MTSVPPVHTNLMPSNWVCRWTHLIPAGSRVLDLACGSGRHMQWLQQQGLQVLGVDRDSGALQAASTFGEVLQADLENQAWPLTGQSFGGIVVTNYLWRALWPDLLAALQPQGVLVYETFALGNQSVGKPSNPDFLLRHGELLDVCRRLRIVAFEDGFCETPDRFVQRIVAVNASVNDSDPPARHSLERLSR